MNKDELRALQAPLKNKYKEEPSSAIVTLSARSRLDSDGIACKVETGKAMVAVGLHPVTGGDGSYVCSGDMLLEALAACAGVTMKAVSTALDIPLRDAVVVAEGDWDARGTLGVSKESPVGLANIRLRFEIDSDAPDEQLAKMVELTERYCVVFQTLRGPTPLSVSHVRK
ncbi:MAG: OsmC family peroxiredoxin [Acidobacteria bacterium]|nr:OsmC family peroxiredoxin [Acidobacteriota bacterium]